mgnify:CR=1 FL=1|jgi:hypothetical protein
MENIFTKLGIINDLSIQIIKFLIESHKNLLNKNGKIEIREIIKYDPKLMVKLKDYLNDDEIFRICAKYGKLENMINQHFQKQLKMVIWKI